MTTTTMAAIALALSVLSTLGITALGVALWGLRKPDQASRDYNQWEGALFEQWQNQQQQPVTASHRVEDDINRAIVRRLAALNETADAIYALLDQSARAVEEASETTQP